MKPHILLVPGLLGSSLTYHVSPFTKPQTLWLNKTNLAIHGLRAAALAPDGISPKLPFGLNLDAGPILDLYRPLASKLLTLYRQTHEVESVAYDWRLSMERSGTLLAENIQGKASPDAPCSLVCHSMGGLVARYAYRVLKLKGLESLVRRVVTLGTPHYGCWHLGEIWGLWDDTLFQLAFISNILSKNAPGLLLLPGPVIHDLCIRAANIINTWPSVYQTVTFVGPVQAEFDPLAARFYDLSIHKNEVVVDAALLAAARTGWQGAMLDPATAIPPEKLFAVGALDPPINGVQFGTPRRLADPAKLDTRDAYGWDDEGDGTVPLWSAVTGTDTFYIIKAAHDLMVQSPVVLSKIDEWLFPTSPAPPIPLPEQIERAQGEIGTPNALPSLSEVAQRTAAGVPSTCVTGPCQC